jgi:hypothetical protein
MQVEDDEAVLQPQRPALVIAERFEEISRVRVVEAQPLVEGRCESIYLE